MTKLEVSSDRTTLGWTDHSHVVCINLVTKDLVRILHFSSSMCFRALKLQSRAHTNNIQILSFVLDNLDQCAALLEYPGHKSFVISRDTLLTSILIDIPLQFLVLKNNKNNAIDLIQAFLKALAENKNVEIDAFIFIFDQ